jgi:hypothetical protein
MKPSLGGKESHRYKDIHHTDGMETSQAYILFLRKESKSKNSLLSKWGLENIGCISIVHPSL